MRHSDFALLERMYGVHLPTVMDYIPAHLAMDYGLAMDAQPALVTVSNSGIPAFLTNYIDPKFVEVLTTPNKGATIIGENKKGDWTTETAFFPMIESAGEVSSYGDYSNNGEVTANANWPQRQSYHYQTITQWGERELDRMAQGKIDWASRLNIASAKIMDKFQNKSYFFGISGLQNYGILNDPRLVTPISPSGSAAWSTKDALQVYTDIKSIFEQLVSQSGGIVEMDARMKLCMSPTISVNLTKVTTYNVSVADMLKKNFPNMTVESAVEYSTDSGQLVQLIAEDVEGQETGYCAFTEKMRAHAIERKTSSFLQKKSGGTWGAIILQPFAIAQMLGV